MIVIHCDFCGKDNRSSRVKLLAIYTSKEAREDGATATEYHICGECEAQIIRKNL